MEPESAGHIASSAWKQGEMNAGAIPAHFSLCLQSRIQVHGATLHTFNVGLLPHVAQSRKPLMYIP